MADMTLEQAAAAENDWVRARIIKREPPPEGSLLKIAERARDMAANSLGREHAAYAVALQNLGLYYDAIENDTAQASVLFAQARAVVKDNDLPLAYGFHWLGLFHNQINGDGARAATALGEALAIQRRADGRDETLLAQTMVALADAKAMTGDIDAAMVLLREALAIQPRGTAAADEAFTETENRLALLEGLASMPMPEDG